MGFFFSSDTLAQLVARAGFDVRLIEKHAPAKHPLSLRCVLAVAAGRASSADQQTLVNRRAGWEAVTACARHAWFAHGKRWLRNALGARARSADS
jgi:hypothetical protein